MPLHDAIVTTLAVGSEYADLAAAFLPHLIRKGNAALAVTDQPAAFEGTGVETIPFVPDGTHIWHAKRWAVRAGLERAWTVYFMDSDHRLYASWEDRVPLLARLPPGVSSFKGSMRLELFWRLLQWGTLADAKSAAWLDRITCECMGLADWRDLPWWGDWIFAVTRDAEHDSGIWPKFTEAWDRFAIWQRGNPSPYALVGGDGFAMTLAAAHCKWTPVQHVEAFAPLVRAFSHLFSGQRAGRDR